MVMTMMMRVLLGLSYILIIMVATISDKLMVATSPPVDVVNAD